VVWLLQAVTHLYAPTALGMKISRMTVGAAARVVQADRSL
jgi:hypothetical protein